MYRPSRTQDHLHDFSLISDLSWQYDEMCKLTFTHTWVVLYPSQGGSRYSTMSFWCALSSPQNVLYAHINVDLIWFIRLVAIRLYALKGNYPMSPVFARSLLKSLTPTCTPNLTPRSLMSILPASRNRCPGCRVRYYLWWETVASSGGQQPLVYTRVPSSCLAPRRGYARLGLTPGNGFDWPAKVHEWPRC